MFDFVVTDIIKIVLSFIYASIASMPPDEINKVGEKMFLPPIDIGNIKKRLLAEEKRKKEGIKEEILVPKKLAISLFIFFILFSILLGIIGIYVTK